MLRVFLGLLFVYSVSLHAQVTAPIPAILKKMAEQPGAVNSLFLHNEPFFKGLPYPFETAGCSFVKTPDGVYALVNGTGRIYALDTLRLPAQWIRIDSTYFTGYNLGCLNFYADSTLYSYGGYGLWNNNGHLRYYASNKHEWEIRPLNREVPHIFQTKDMFHLDTANGFLYMQGIHAINDALKSNKALEAEIGGRTWRLNLHSGDWEELGTSKDTTLLILAFSPWGALTLMNGKAGLVDFDHNRYLHANDRGLKKFSQYTNSTRDKKLVFFADSTLFFGDLNQYVDSIQLSLADFTDTGIAIYNPPIHQTKWPAWSWWLVAAVAVFTFLAWLWFRRKPKPIASSPKSPDLEERDRILLQTFLDAARKGKPCDIDSLNALLGVGNKSLEVQKRQRSDALNALQQNLRILLETDQPFIIRTRSEQDRRSFFYEINPDLLPLLEQFMAGKR
jgi:hypothetical protein